MAIIKCKMCGGDIHLAEDKTFGTCEYCGSVMTLPRVSDDQRAAAFNRGNHFRRIGEFDKALEVYERIVAEDDTDAEAHWCCALCRFGIEWVEDPNTLEYVPTCHRASFDSFLEDVDYLAALEHSDGVTRRQYQKDGTRINEVQRSILATSRNEKPFDVFICYKELDDETGERTRDSIDAQEIYYNLTQEGYRVFFSRITLEDKAGTEYEPYIFAALNSAKVMVVLGSKPEYFSAVWVKNEWSRFLTLMHKDRSKLLIPCYKNMDPYDLPDQLSVLMSYDMTRIGFMQDLLRGIRKVLRRDEPKPAVKETVVVQQSGGPNANSLLQRAFIFLEINDWQNANDYCERVLDQAPTNGMAYVGKMMAELRVPKREELKGLEQPFDNRTDYKLAIRYGDDALREELEGYNAVIRARIEEKRLTGIYNEIQNGFQRARTEKDWLALAERFDALGSFRDAGRQAENCRKKADTAKKAAAFESAAAAMSKAATEEDFQKAAAQFDALSGFRDAEKKAQLCREKAEEARREEEYRRKKTEEARREEEKRRAEAEAKRLSAEQEKQRREEARARQKAERAAYVTASTKRSKTPLVIALAALLAVGGLTAFLLSRGKNKEPELPAPSAVPSSETAAPAPSAVPAAGLDLSNIDYAELAVRSPIAARQNHSLAVRSDGTATAVGMNAHGQCNVSDWTDIVAVTGGWNYAIGLRSDGTVIATEDKDNPTGTDVSDWKNIVAVSASMSHTVGLRSDGTVVATGDNSHSQCDVSGWTDITAVSAGYRITIGLRSDGTVLVAGELVDDHGNGIEINVSGWTGIVAVAAGFDHMVGLRADGTVVAVGDNTYGQCDVYSWRGIVAVSAGEDLTIGLRANRSVVAVGNNDSGQCNVSDWWNVVAVSAGRGHALGLRADGTVVAAGDNSTGQCGVKDWTDIRVPVKAAQSAGQEPEEELPEEERIYREAEQLAADGKIYEAATTFYTIKDYKDSWDRCFSLWGEITSRKTFYISIDGSATVRGWWDTVVAEWDNLASFDAYDVANNTDYFGLKNDGSLVTVDRYGNVNYEVSDWSDIVSFSAGPMCLIGLKADGTVLATFRTRDARTDRGQCEVSGWKDVVMVSAGKYYTAGLKADGTVLLAGEMDDAAAIGAWTDVVAIDSAYYYTVGLRSDGTVVAAGKNGDGQCNVSDWSDIVAIDMQDAERGCVTYGLRSDGTIVTTNASLNSRMQKAIAVQDDFVQIYVCGRWAAYGLHATGEWESLYKNILN